MSQQKNKSSASPPPPEMDGRFQRLLSLLGLLKEARHKARKTELEFMMVNQTFNLVPYRHCIFWEWDGDHVSIRTASGLVQVDPTGPYTLWLKKVIVSQLPRDTSGQAPENAQEKPAPEGYSVLLEVSQDDCRPQERSEWKKWSSTRVLLAVMKDRHKKTIGGLWLDREEPFDELERAMLEDLCDGYAHALHRYQERHGVSGRFHWRKLFKLSGKNLRIACIALSLLMLLPVHISVTAPAEVVAHEPFVISIPFDGTIGSIEVKPGQTVKAGDVLLRMDSTVLQNKVEIAQSEMLTAEIALRKTEREALTDAGGQDQKSDRPTDESLLRRGKHLIHLLLEGRLRGDIGIDHVPRFVQAGVPLLADDLDRPDHVALPQRVDGRLGKIRSTSWLLQHSTPTTAIYAAVRYVSLRNLGRSRTETIFTRSRTESTPTIFPFSVTAR